MKEFEGATITEEYINAVKIYVDYCRTIINNPKKLSYGVEESFELTQYMGGYDCGGSADFSSLIGNTKRKQLEIVDYKHGSGIVVEVEEDGKPNAQAMLYALGLYKEVCRRHSAYGSTIKKIKLTIVQPRVSHVDGPIRSTTIRVKDLLKFEQQAYTAIQQGESGNGVFVAGDHCTFCPRAGLCKENASHSMELAQVDFANIDDDLIAPNQLTKSEVELVLANASKIKKWLDSVQMYATDVADKGQEFNNYKLVERFGHRKYSKKESLIVRKLKRLGYDESVYYGERSLRTPNQLQQALQANGMSAKEAKEFVDGYSEKPEIGRSLVPLTDGRAIAKTTAESDFADTVENNRKKRKKKERK